jgi:hypothetical protein
MNIHESQLDEFRDEQKFKQLNLSEEQQEAWIQVELLYPPGIEKTLLKFVVFHCCRVRFCLGWYGQLERARATMEEKPSTFYSEKSAKDLCCQRQSQLHTPTTA